MPKNALTVLHAIDREYSVDLTRLSIYYQGPINFKRCVAIYEYEYFLFFIGQPSFRKDCDMLVIALTNNKIIGDVYVRDCSTKVAVERVMNYINEFIAKEKL